MGLLERHGRHGVAKYPPFNNIKYEKYKEENYNAVLKRN